MDLKFRVDDGSKRHHYIAEFYSKGFANERGLLYVYDKQKDEFQKPRSPKQLFYEDEGNTAYWGEVRNTIAEQGFKHLDDLTVERVNTLRTKDRVSLTEDDTTFMMYHMVIQYLRCPSNFGMYRYLYETIGTWAPEFFKDAPLMKLFPKDETLMKISRSFLPGFIVNRLAQVTPGPYPISVLEHYTEDFLVLTDNPVVYFPPPVDPPGLFTNNMLAVSSRRLFVGGDLKRLGADLALLESYNVAAITQAERLVCASNEKALRNAVEAWKWASASKGYGAHGYVRSDAGGYWKGIASTMNAVFDHLCTDSGWHEDDAIIQAVGDHRDRVMLALETLVTRGVIVKKPDVKGVSYRMI